MKLKKLLPIVVTFLSSLPLALAQRINFTNATNSNDTLAVFTFVNNQSGQIFGSWIIIGIFLVSFLGLKVYFSKQAFVAASFITFLTSMFLWLMDWVNGTWLIAGVLLLAFGVAALIYDSGS